MSLASETGVFFFSDTFCTKPASKVTIAQETDRTDFFIRPPTTGNHRLTAQSARGNLFSASYSIEVITPALLVLSPDSMDFGNIFIGKALEIDLTVSNTGQSRAPALSVSLEAPYTAQGGTCGSTLAGGASCIQRIRFTPMEKGLYQACGKHLCRWPK